jgi:hypothetical protein
MSDLFCVNIKGKDKYVDSWQIGPATVVNFGRFLKIAEVFDEYWLDTDSLPDPEIVLAELHKKKDKPDLFTFAQRVPDGEPKYNFYLEWENIAAVPISTYEQWYQKQIPPATRRNIRASEKRGVTVRISEYDEKYIHGITSIYSESPVRQGRRFWHYGKDFETVKKENGTYAERSTFLAAYHQGEMIGYLKIVWDKHVARIMQILSKMAFMDIRPNNALLAEAVRQCCIRGVNYLLYYQFTYGNKSEDSLTKFKRNNGFVRMNIPRYYVPLTKKGSLVLHLGLHRNPRERLPEWIMSPARDLRAKWYEWRAPDRKSINTTNNMSERV